MRGYNFWYLLVMTELLKHRINTCLTTLVDILVMPIPVIDTNQLTSIPLIQQLLTNTQHTITELATMLDDIRIIKADWTRMMEKVPIADKTAEE